MSSGVKVNTCGQLSKASYNDQGTHEVKWPDTIQKYDQCSQPLCSLIYGNTAFHPSPLQLC